MKQLFNKSYEKISLGLFCLIIFLGFWFIFDPSCVYFQQQPIFLTTNFYFINFLKYPGGFAEYIGTFLGQFLYIKITGSVIITLIIFVSILLTKETLKIFSKENKIVLLQFIPSILFAGSLVNYDTNFQLIITYIITSFLFIVNSKIKHQAIRVIVYTLFQFIIFYLFSSSALYLFTTLVILFELTQHSKKNKITATSVAFIFSILLVYFFARISPYMNTEKALKGIFFNASILSLAAYISLPLTIIMHISIGHKFQKHISTFTNSLIAFASIALLVISLWGTFNKTERDLIKILQYASEEKWDEVISIGKELPINERKVIFEVNRALYHQGVLLDSAFQFQQYYGTDGLILTAQYSSKVLMQCSDLFEDMQYTKGALHWAYEAQTKVQLAPNVLKRIIEDNIILGDYLLAEKFLKILSKSMVHKKWVEEHSKYLNNEALINTNLKFSKARESLFHEVFLANTSDPSADLVELLSINIDNKMAFEYLMLYSLLRHDMTMVARNLDVFKYFDYKKLPKHIEECLLLLQIKNPDKRLVMQGYEFSENTLRNFKEYSLTLANYKGVNEESQKGMLDKFGNTYWYYINFVSPITNKREYQTK